MIKKRQSWFGVVFILGAIVFFFSSIHLVDVPGPMSADKPEFLFESTTSLVVASDILGLAGLTCLLWRPKERR
jgi:hypothetical protein